MKTSASKLHIGICAHVFGHMASLNLRAVSQYGAVIPLPTLLIKTMTAEN